MSIDKPKPPSDWEIKPLREISDVIVSNVDKKTVAGQTPVRLCNYTDVYDNNDITSQMTLMEASAKPSEIAKFTLKRGDVIITKDSETPNDIGVPSVVREDMPGVLCGYHLSMIRLKTDEHNPVFLARQIASHRIARYFGQQANGTTRYGLNIKPVEETEIWLAPPDEQRRIAEILDTADEAIQKTEALIAKLKQMKAGLLHDLLTRGIDENGELRPSNTLRGFAQLPNEWIEKPLQDWCSETITYGIVQAGPHVVGGVPYVRTGDMNGDSLEREGLLCTSPTIARNFKRSEVKVGEIVCAIRATVGKVLEVPDELDGANLTQGTARIAPIDEINSRCLLWMIRSNLIQRQIESLMKGTTFAEITLGQLREIRIMLPRRRKEQDAIVERLDSHDNHIKSETVVLEKLKELKAGLMHDLLTGKKRVRQPAVATA